MSEDFIDVEAEQNESDPIDESTCRRKRKRLPYALKRKLEVVEYTKKFGNCAAAKKFSINRSTIFAWTKNEANITRETE